jgi:hypothetical protein
MSSPLPYIHLHADDNVYVLIRGLSSGEEVNIEDDTYTFIQELSLGHKIASTDIAEGSKVFKYGMSIGVASKPIKRGEHVHLHNLESEYTATYTLDKERRFV